MSIADHVETYLGKISDGLSLETPLGSVTVARFVGRPHRYAETFVTLGLSEKPLAQPSGAEVRQELVLCGPSTLSARSVYALFGALVSEILHSGRALTRGQVLGPSGPLFEGASVTALFCMQAAFLPDAFSLFKPQEGPPVLFVWLVPLTDYEARLASTIGASAFEAKLERWQGSENLLDFTRVGMVSETSLPARPSGLA